jgi:hypothetical protein
MWERGYTAIESTRGSGNVGVAAGASIPLYGLQLAVLRIDRQLAFNPFLASLCQTVESLVTARDQKSLHRTVSSFPLLLT